MVPWMGLYKIYFINKRHTDMREKVLFGERSWV